LKQINNNPNNLQGVYFTADGLHGWTVGGIGTVICLVP
jgi:hypothetical protein